MKEKVWVNIPLNYLEVLRDWSQFFAYESEDEENGKLVVYEFTTNTKEYCNFDQFLKENTIKHYIFRRVYTFTKREKDNAEILWLWTDDDAKESYTPELINHVCDACGKKIPHLDRHLLHVDYKKIKKYDIMSTYHGDTETIVSEKIKHLFNQEGITGVEFEPIYQIGKENQVIEGFYHLILREGIGDVVEPSEIIKKDYCPVCGFYDDFRCKTTLNFKRNTWKGLDICYTKNWFGGPPKFKSLIISNKLYRVLEQNKIKHVYFQPAYLID
ncbi:hypothetical protein Sgly_0736 [Syntrophobotulus glycolicus DSM 8271]|uniref:Uncharacterized protein n=1 Tax=Syntrophobotulus glycolicus (strain DSM 8271 / FlGlyR) TaxID=645991 RepID=F0T0N2_SYNGF|nr:hypothetical protein [Syntrophobotulus glycolicus]ADY55097.1 hypothetical protein Sgly_0736 [Syntrophobotulus glycolicus DSM 8271]